MQRPILLTLVLCLTLIAALAQLTRPDSPAVGTTDRPSLPPDIVAGEADYEARQRALDQALRQVQMKNLAESPDVLRSRMQAWLHDNRAVLDEQAARSDALDALYTQHGIIEPGPSEMLRQHAPKTDEEAAAPAGRRWALAHELALLREANAGDPEALRDSVRHWLQVHGTEMEEANAALRTEAVSPRDAQDEDAAKPAPTAAEVTDAFKDAPESVRDLVTLKSQMRVLLAENPFPVPQAGIEATTQDLEAWRDTIQRAARDTTAAIDRLQQQISAEAQQRLAQEHSHDHSN